ncbi:MAG: alginate biosynthesis protein AlgX [Moraxellaceae bacterium]|jgi:alginate biosynthesis protein AlgX|nr:alginate biosynthesis protein AlgX [Moraxellaceae bacterium]
MKKCRLSLLALGLGIGLFASNAQARCAPGTTCFELCPEVELETSYNTAGKALRYLFNGDGSWIFATDLDLRQDFTFSPDAMAGLAKLKRIFDHHGTTVVIVYTPPRALVHPDKVSRSGYSHSRALQSYFAANQQLRSLGYVVPDFGRIIPDKTGKFFQRRDHHWTTVGAQMSARLVADTIRELPVYEKLAKQEFVTELKGIVKKYGTLSTVATRICGMSLPNQYVQLYTTLPKNNSGASDEAALFGDDARKAEIALIGTSFSKGKLDYNFAGFMEEYLSAAIDNRAIRGGAYNGALEQVILDGMFASNPPKILIWELPGQFTLDSPGFYRLIGAELSGGCKAAGRLSGKSPVGMEENDAVANAENGVVLPLVARNHLLKFRFSDPAVYSFFLNLTYMSGHHEKLKVERHPYVKHDGTFYFELPDTGKFADDTLYSVGLRLPQPLEKKVDVEVEVCERNVI